MPQSSVLIQFSKANLRKAEMQSKPNCENKQLNSKDKVRSVRVGVTTG